MSLIVMMKLSCSCLTPLQRFMLQNQQVDALYNTALLSRALTILCHIHGYRPKSCISLLSTELNYLCLFHAECILQDCSGCGQQFRTYVPGKDTLMPDGSSFFYSSPQTECPVCDTANWGWQWNKDLFPEFADTKTLP